MTPKVWRGFHGPVVHALIAESWDKKTPLILCPPHIQNFEFLKIAAPAGFELVGDWTPELSALSREQDSTAPFSHQPAARIPSELDERPIFQFGIFTSGTLSRSPRLVLYSRENILSTMRSLIPLFDDSQIESIFCYAQPFHTFGLILGYLNAHIHRKKLVVAEGKYGSHAHQRRVSTPGFKMVTLGTPTHFHDLLRYIEREQIVLPATYSAVIGGARVARSLWLDMREVLNIQAPSIGYGCTEATLGMTHLPPGEEPKLDYEIGYPLPSLTLRVVSAGVEMSGPSLCSAIIENGRLSHPETLTVRDLVEVHGDHRWVFRGRLDLILNRGGEKFLLEEIEQAIRSSLAIEVICVGLFDERLGEDLGVLASGTPNAHSAQKIFDICTKLFQIKLKGQNLAWVDQFELNNNGKPDRARAGQTIQDRHP
jgi:acyl-CoA synthetase (AMP-forming)/AMP-acid ligase II